jgi:Ni,Fe-hydrogenase I cytochrome b subunit
VHLTTQYNLKKTKEIKMNWMIKVSIGMLLFATLLIALGVAFIRANEYKPAMSKVQTKTETETETKTIAPSPVLMTEPEAKQTSTPIEKIPAIKK